MRSGRRSIAVLAAAGALAFPSVAFGQGAGDQQYQDPFGSSGSGGSGGSSGSGSSSGSGNAGSSSSPSAAADQGAAPLSPESPSSGGTGTQSASSAGGRQLAATGADAGLLALVGLGFLLIGSGLRVRLGETEPPPAAE
jgi:hypothetical protein